jgi:trimethylamine--corrinoid protein Co-methyltransferase
MLATAALSDMAKHYRLPIFSFAGCSDSKLFDQQASLESALWILIVSLHGGNLVHDVGYIESGLTTSYEQLVVSNEIAGMVRRIIQGFEIDEDTLALDLIDSVGPGGEYLTTDHTLKHFKKNWFPDLISRVPYEKWEQEGKKDLGTRARDRILHVIENHNPKPLPDDVKLELQNIVQSRDS